jgi:hypothetical protein
LKQVLPGIPTLKNISVREFLLLENFCMALGVDPGGITRFILFQQSKRKWAVIQPLVFNQNGRHFNFI